MVERAASPGPSGGVRLPVAEAAALLAVLELSSRARANAAGQGTAARGAVLDVLALTANELPAVAIADILVAGGIEGGAADAGLALLFPATFGASRVGRWRGGACRGGGLPVAESAALLAV